jgi:ABC-type transport system involved in multi-copper enzyme maturation permease subunit
MHRHSPSHSPSHPFGQVHRNLPRVAILLRVYFIYLLLSALFFGFLWWFLTRYVEEPVAAAVFSLVAGGPFVLFFSLVPLRFSMVYYPAPYDYKEQHFFAALWFGINGGRAVPMANWLCRHFGGRHLPCYQPSEKDHKGGLRGRSSLLTDFTSETPVD